MLAITPIINGFVIGSCVSAWISAYQGPCPPRALACATIAAGFATLAIALQLL
jgi:hypothetical protein